MATEKSSDSNAFSEASAGVLKDVKKGKARKFVMLCKGPAIVSVVVFKKGSFEKYKKEAKETGTGQFYYGVVDGQGDNISFKLARSDGFDKAPVKSNVLKSFLQDEGDFRCKPLIEIVDTTPSTLDPDDNPLVARFQQLQPRVHATLQQSPDKASAIEALCGDIGRLLEDDQNDPAAAKLDELENLLSPPQETAGPSTSGPAEGDWRRRLAEVDPPYQRALQANSPDSGKFRAVMMFAVEKAGAGDYAKAIAALDRLAPMLASASTAPPVAGVSPDAASPADVDDGEPLKTFSIVNVQSARLVWDNTRKKVQEDLMSLDTAIRKAVTAHNADVESPTEYIDGEVDLGVQKLYQILDVLDHRLIDTLDGALNADGKQRETLHRQAIGLIREYQSFVKESPLMKRIDKNPFLGCSVKQRVDAALSALAKTL